MNGAERVEKPTPWMGDIRRLRGLTGTLPLGRVCFSIVHYSSLLEYLEACPNNVYLTIFALSLIVAREIDLTTTTAAATTTRRRFSFGRGEDNSVSFVRGKEGANASFAIFAEF